MNIKLIIAYEGTKYQGWQRLKGKEDQTIQGILEQVLSDLLEETITIIGSGRTDACVHACGQVANFHTKKEIEIASLRARMNQRLPADIQVIELQKVEDSFHSRFDAKSKIYEYHIETDEKADVFTRTMVYVCQESLDRGLLREAAKLLEGTHDFVGFSSKMVDGRNTIKTIYQIEVIEQGSKLILRFHGDGFLYHMIRIMVGTLLEIAAGKKPLSTISEVFRTKNRQYAGKTIGANGLKLYKIVY